MTANAAGITSEFHRYFPEWADRPIGPDPQRESDRNSYLAGGYADEFGYGRQFDRPPAIPALDGDPEISQLWREQIGALHPGYPECPKPLDRMRGPDGHPAHPARARDRGAGNPATRSDRAEPHGAGVGFRVIPVRPRGRAPSQVVFRVGLLAYIADRLMRRRHLNDVL